MYISSLHTNTMPKILYHPRIFVKLNTAGDKKYIEKADKRSMPYPLYYDLPAKMTKKSDLMKHFSLSDFLFREPKYVRDTHSGL